MAVSYKKQTHKSKGRAGKTPHPSGMSPHSGARKNRLTKALREREERVAQRKMNKNKTVPKPKRKPPVPKVPTIKQTAGSMKRRPTMKEQLDASGVGIDYSQMAGGGQIYKREHGGKVIKSNMSDKDKKVPVIKAKPGPHKVRPPGYKTPKIKKPTDKKSGFEGYMEKTQSKKYGGKISYRMGGGQVVASCYD